MIYLIIAYSLIAAVLSGYGISVWAKTHQAEAEIQCQEDTR